MENTEFQIGDQVICYDHKLDSFSCLREFCTVIAIGKFIYNVKTPIGAIFTVSEYSVYRDTKHNRKMFRKIKKLKYEHEFNLGKLHVKLNKFSKED